MFPEVFATGSDENDRPENNHDCIEEQIGPQIPQLNIPLKSKQKHEWSHDIERIDPWPEYRVVPMHGNVNYDVEKRSQHT